MLVLFLLLQFKLHINDDPHLNNEYGDLQEVDQKRNQINSNFRSIKDDESGFINYTFNDMEFANIQHEENDILDIVTPDNQKYIIVFQGCTFRANTNSKGGALLFNETRYPNAVGLTFQECNFIQNHADDVGGALAIYGGEGLTFKNCNFENNDAANAGAVYIEPKTSVKDKCTFDVCTFIANSGRDSKCIWVNVPSNNDQFTLELTECTFNDNTNPDYKGGACCVSNCQFTNVENCYFINKDNSKSSGGVNVTAKGSLTVRSCNFTKCNAGDIDGSYGGGIGYTGLVNKDSTRIENIIIDDCTFIDNTGKNGVALLLSVISMNVSVSDVQVLNHYRTKYIFCIFFNKEVDGEVFRIENAYFNGNSYDNVNGDEYCGGSGIWIAEARPQDYLESLTVQFEDCQFNNNFAPGNGGAFGYQTSERLKAVHLAFIRTEFKDNHCGKSMGGACSFLTKKSVELRDCTFDNNTCDDLSENGGGGALYFSTTVKEITITGCSFKNCQASHGSFIFTQGAVDEFDIQDNTFEISNFAPQNDTVYLSVDPSPSKIFNFVNNNFTKLTCTGKYGGSGLHIITGRDCEVTSCAFNTNKGENGQIEIPDSSNSKLIFKKCLFERGSQDSPRAIYVAQDASVDFDTCTFKNFNFPLSNEIGTIGVGVLIYSLSENKYSSFENCTFNDVSCFSALHFPNCKVINFNKCNLTKIEAIIPEKGKELGGILYFEKLTEFTLTNCMFKECGSIDMKNNPAIKLCSSVETASIINSTFDRCGRYNKGGAISARNVTDIRIINCIFVWNMAQAVIEDTLSVYVGEGSQNCNISNCILRNRNKGNDATQLFEFRVFSSYVTFSNNLFERENGHLQNVNDDGFGGIYFGQVKELTISNNIFKETHNTAVYAFNVGEVIAINNTWDGCCASKYDSSPRAFYIKTTNDLLTFRNNTVKNCPEVSRNNYIMHFESKGSILIDGCIFTNNVGTANGGGGIGAVFNCINSTITIENCTFKENKAKNVLNLEYGGFGGALQIGGNIFRDTSYTSALEVFSCTFESNYAYSKGGGAITFSTEKDNIIQYCTFISNTGKENAGAVLITPMKYEINTPNREGTNLITNCTFNGNNAENAVGHSIYSWDKSHSTIQNCEFVGKTTKYGGQISYERRSNWGNYGYVDILYSNFRIDTNSNAHCGIEAQEHGRGSIHLCHFYNFKENDNDKGNAINLCGKGGENLIYENTFNNCGKKGYLVVCRGYGIDFYENIINFDELSQSCGYVEILGTYSNSIYKIHDNSFHDCNPPANGVLHFKATNENSMELIIKNNIFERLNGTNTFSAFNIQTLPSVKTTFHNNIIQNNSPRYKKYLCGFDFQGKYVNSHEFIIKNISFINNTCNSPFGGGIGFWAQNKEVNANANNLFTFIFEDCLFENNYAQYSGIDRQAPNGRGGAVQIGHTESMTAISPSFIGCRFLQNRADNEGGALSLSVIGKVTIQDCMFNNNKAGLKPSEESSIYYGGALMFDANFDENSKGHFSTGSYSELYNVINSTFINNNAPGATTIYLKKADKTQINIEENCQFIDNGNKDNVIVANGNDFSIDCSIIKFTNPDEGTARGITVLGQATITETSFFNVRCTVSSENNYTTAIYLSSTSHDVNIDKCILSDCGKQFVSNNHQTILVDTTFSVKIQNSIINFTDINNACGGIKVLKYGPIYIRNNYFTKTFGQGSLFYNPEAAGQQVNDVFFEGNIFDNVKSHNGSTRAVQLNLLKGNILIFNNTIENIPDSAYTFVITISGFNELEISHCKFKNIVSSDHYGGGAGFWVSEKRSSLFDLVLDGCTFENSYAKYSKHHNNFNSDNGFGGGLQIGVSSSISNVNLNLKNCIFKENRADRSGGALSLGTEKDIIIDNCTFIDNIAGVDTSQKYYGGAVFFDTCNTKIKKPELITFSKCTFRNNTSPNGDGYAMYISDLPDTEIKITDKTIFEDNGFAEKNDDFTSVVIDSKILTIELSTFTHKNSDYSSRDLEVYSETFSVTNTLFQNSTNGLLNKANAIWIREKVLTSQIDNCNFIDCGNLRGDVIRSETRELIFDKSTIKFNHHNGTRGIYIDYPSKLYVLQSHIIQCRADVATHYGAGIHYFGNGPVKLGYSEEINIEGTTFDGNYGAHTSSLYLQRIKKFPTLCNLTIKNSGKFDGTGGDFTLVVFFDFLPKEEFVIENITFENNKFDRFDGGGSGIWIAEYNPSQTTRDTWQLTLENCVFRNNHAKQSGGAISYGDSRTLTFIHVNFNRCQFIDNECEGLHDNNHQGVGSGGGALWINSQETVEVNNCYFTGNRVLEQTTRASGRGLKGHAIYAASRSYINVENTKFVDNTHDGLESVIQISGQEFNLTESEISFTKSDNGCRGVYIDFPGITKIKNTKFINCGKSNVEEAGAIYYKNAYPDSVLEEQITVDGCTFDNCLAKNGCAMLFWASATPTLSNNKVINQKSGKYVISIFYTSFQDYSIVENMNFIGGSAGGEDGGGSSIWIANNKEISNGRPSELIFRNCRWENNTTPHRGGAFHYGNSQTLVGMEITFEDCHFINNHAGQAGGAVSLKTISPSIFRNCEFNGNTVKSSITTQGSAIYLDGETPLCLISGCTFTNSTADEGNAIFASNNVNALHITDNTRIFNCGSSGSCVVVLSKEFFFIDSQVTYDNINNAARGILVKTLSSIRISNSKFVKCSYTTNYPNDSDRQGQGGAILIQRNKVETDNQEEIELLYTTFDSCKSDNGCAIFFWITTNPTIRGNYIINHNYNKYIFTIVRTTNFADQFTIENCTFMKNKFSNKNKQDGGGAAIWVANQQYFNEGSLASLIFKDCNWTKNTGVYGGAFSYGSSNTVKFIMLNFQNCHFENNQASGDQGGALHLTTAVPVSITGCTFYNNKCVNNLQNFGGEQALGGALYLDTNATSVLIMNTTFRKNSAQNGNALFVSRITPLVQLVDSHFLSNSNGNVGAQVAHQGIELIANNTNFDYQVVTLHSKGIDILSKSRTTFEKCNFTLCETPYDKGGALFVEDKLNSNNIEELKLQDCIFDNCNSSEGSAIYAKLSSKPTIRKCTVKNNNQGCSVFVLMFVTEEPLPVVEIETCTFQNNVYMNTPEQPDGGGSGIWISNANKLQFTDCDFIKNKADYVGGALAFGHDAKFAECSIQFDNCIFEDNTCNGKYGGALYLVNSKPVIIRNSNFKGNRPLASDDLKGGDIYIDSSSTVDISSSTFESSTAQISEGNALYCSSRASTLTLSDANFINCGTSGTVAVSYAKSTIVYESHFKFTEAANGKSARGLAIYIIHESFVHISRGTSFTNCYFSTQDNSLGGGGLYIKYIDEETTSSEQVEISDCIFDGTISNNGGALYLDVNLVPTLRAIQVFNCNCNNHILSINYRNSVESTELDGCIFDGNSFSTSGDGGGAGIWIAQTKKLVFSGCSFKDNTATGNGGAFAYYNNQNAKETTLEFNGCTFYQNEAQSAGGALYLVTEQPVSIRSCIFDGNIAKSQDGAIHVDSKASIHIEMVNIARNKATGKNAGIYINSAQTLEFNNNTISDNECQGSPTGVEINNEGIANIKENKFDFTRQSDSQYQISLTGRSTSAVCNFELNCFTHKGQVDNNLVHILSTHSGQLNIPAGNCFDSGQYGSLQHNGGQASIGENIFDCKKCGEIYVPTAAPEATPTPTRQMTAKPTDIPVPTEKPYIPTPLPTQSLHPSEEEPDITTESSSSDGNNTSNKGKKKSVNIGMIAGITVAVVVVIVVVIILLWLFVFRRRRNNPQGTNDSYTPNTMDETNSGISGTTTTQQDDPIWAGATATHDNPLFNGSDDNDDDHMNAGFEESWGENVI